MAKRNRQDSAQDKANIKNLQRSKKKKRRNNNRKAEQFITEEDMKNPMLEGFYKYQSNIFSGRKSSNIPFEENKACDAEAEYNSWLTSVKTPLPLTFRINRAHPNRAKRLKGQFDQIIENFEEKPIDMNDYYRATYSSRMNHLLNKDKSELTNDESQEIEVLKSKIKALETKVIPLDPPKRMEWYPGQCGYRFNISKAIFKKHPGLKKMRSVVNAYVEEGMISRQEEVSMLPTHFFDIKPHHRVLDMCAAPGSKTAQLVEALYENSKHKDTFEDVTGFVIANDNNTKRCHMLTSQLQRLGPFFKSAIVTNHDATRFPNIYEADDSVVLFDAILCDVMCSGDGTLRKSPDIWPRWTPRHPLPLHKLQIGVVERAIKLLKPGGRIVFSTCSLNPLEDEAILAEILRRHRGTIHLTNQHDRLQNFEYSAGISNWTVTTPENKVITKEDYLAIPKENREQELKYFSESMFPPTEEEASWMNLHYGMRIVPHYQNTGGFYIAVLEKVNNETPVLDEVEEEKREIKKRSGIRYFGELSSMCFKPIKNEVINSCSKLLEIPVEHLQSTLLHRTDKFAQSPQTERTFPKRIFEVPSSFHSIALNPKNDRMVVVNAGMPLFEHVKGNQVPSSFPYRTSLPGAQSILHTMNPNRIITVDLKSFETLMSIGDQGVYWRDICQNDDIFDDILNQLNSLNPGLILFKLDSNTLADDVFVLPCSYTKTKVIVKQAKLNDIKLLQRQLVNDGISESS